MTVLVTNVESQATLPGSVEVGVQAVVVEEEDSVEGEGLPEVTNVTTVEKLGTLPASALTKCRSPEEEEGGVVGVEPATPVERKATCPGTVLMEAPGEAAVEETRSATTATGPDIWPVIAPTLAAAVAAVVVVVAGNRLATTVESLGTLLASAPTAARM